MKVIVASTFFQRSLGLIPKQLPRSLRLIPKRILQSLRLTPKRILQSLRLIPKRSQQRLGLNSKQLWLGAELTAEHTVPSLSVLDPNVLFFPRCQSLHTIGMVRSIDIAFIDVQNRVLASRREVPPLQIVSCPGASGALERFSHDSWWPDQGETLRLTEVK